MGSIEKTLEAVADLPKIRSKLTLRSATVGLAQALLLLLIYVMAINLQPVLLGVNSLVFAYCASRLLFLPFIIGEDLNGFQSRRNGWLFIGGFAAVASAFILLVNDPVLVKRLVSILAVLEIAFYTLAPLLVKKQLFRSSDFDPKRFSKSRKFKMTAAAVVLFINEVVIWMSDDWLWIASRAAVVILIPLIYVFVANYMQTKTS